MEYVIVGRFLMDQKNTIVKCKAHPDCLFNHNGVCDNYVINIDEDGKCESYVETENVYTPPSGQEILEYTIKLEQEKLRGQRAKCNFHDDMMDINDKHLGESAISDWDYAATPDICKTCKKVVYGQPCKYKDVTYGIWTCWEKKNEV